MKQRAYMNKMAINGFMAFALGLMTQQITQAQGTITYLSNLGQPPAGSNPVGSDSWLGAGFRTGTNAGGYLLDSVQMAMTEASGNPSGFMAMLYTESSNLTTSIPGSSLGTLEGPLNPTTAGIYTYAPASSPMLSPRTDYFIVLTAGTTVANGAYSWSVMNTASYNPSGGWGASVTLSSMNGSSWTPLPTYPLFDFSQFAITATPIPEPTFLSLFLLVALGVLWHRRKTKPL